jgi:molybdate transport system substrate-binding protein
MATRALLADLAAEYTRRYLQPIELQAGGGVEVAQRIRDGEAVDIVVLAAQVIDKLIAEGKLRSGSRVDVVDSAIAVAVPNGSPKPNIHSEAAVRQAVADAASIGYSTGPSGSYLEKLFARWGLADIIKSRVVVAPPGVSVASLVANGQCALGFQQMSEMMSVPGIAVLGPLPAAIQELTRFSGAVSLASFQPDAAAKVLDAFGSPATAQVKKRHGLETPNSPAG